MNQNILEKGINLLRWQKRLLEYHLLRDNKAIRNYSYEKTVFIASMGRSGSTWLSEIINHNEDYRELFEPFKSWVVPEAKTFHYPKYIPNFVEHKELRNAAEVIIKGRFTNPWTDTITLNTPFPEKILIKDIFSNLLLGWLQTNFLQLKIILLVRHPLDTISSWIRCGFGDAEKEKQYFLNDLNLKKIVPEIALKGLNTTNTTFERLVYYWCIYYFIPLKTLSFKHSVITFYEDLKYCPEQEIPRVFNFLGMQYNPNVLAKIATPSRTATKKNYSQEVLNYDSEQLDYVLNVMKLFGLENLYIGSKPNPKFLESF